MADEEKNEEVEEAVVEEPAPRKLPSPRLQSKRLQSKRLWSKSLRSKRLRSKSPSSEAEEPAVEEAAVAESAWPSKPPPAKKQKSRKHVPRSERRKRSVPAREVLKERKPIVRLPKPEYERANRQERRGVVVSDKADKTIVVKVDVTKLHPRYKKVVRRSVKFHAHDETNQAGIGDIVRIVETRPLSKTKCWRLAEIVEKAK